MIPISFHGRCLSISTRQTYKISIPKQVESTIESNKPSHQIQSNPCSNITWSFHVTRQSHVNSVTITIQGQNASSLPFTSAVPLLLPVTKNMIHKITKGLIKEEMKQLMKQCMICDKTGTGTSQTWPSLATAGPTHARPCTYMPIRRGGGVYSREGQPK